MEEDDLKKARKAAEEAFKSIQINPYAELQNSMDFIKVPSLEVVSPYVENSSKRIFEKIVAQIKIFENELDQEHEIGAHLISFGDKYTFHIDEIGIITSDILSFWGRDKDGNKLQLIQHMSQLNILLLSLPKLNKEPRRVGFILPNKPENPDQSSG